MSQQPDGTTLFRLFLGAAGESIVNGEGALYAGIKNRFALRDAI